MTPPTDTLGATRTRQCHAQLRARAWAWAAIALAACATGCTGFDPDKAGPPYPQDKPQTRVLDIQVVRSPTHIELTNTTAYAFGRSRLWINRWYSREIDGLAVGQTLDLPLLSFYDEFGDTFRAGGFFATRVPSVVELVQLETSDGMLGLVAVGKPQE